MLAGSNFSRNAENELETGEPDVEIPPATENRIIKGSLWMFTVTLALFFLPVLNGIIAGLIGGYKVGSAKNALMAAILPALGGGLLLWVVLSLIPLPFIGAAAGAAITAVLILLSDAALLVGAALGGTLAQNKMNRLKRF